jgi:hypothetical protein
MKFIDSVKAIISSFRSVKGDNTGRQETLAMVYGGDIYAVLVRDRAARQLAMTQRRRGDHRRDASWPFIR